MPSCSRWRLGWADLGALAEGAGGSGEGADGDAVELAAQFRPGAPGGVLGDAGEEQGEPAQEDVGADPLFQPVVDRAQVDDLLEVAPAARVPGPVHGYSGQRRGGADGAQNRLLALTVTTIGCWCLRRGRLRSAG
jgi:hypothetical protein